MNFKLNAGENHLKPLLIRTEENKYIRIDRIDYFFCKAIEYDLDIIYPFGIPRGMLPSTFWGIYAHIANQDLLVETIESTSDQNTVMTSFLSEFYLRLNKERDDSEYIVWDLYEKK